MTEPEFTITNNGRRIGPTRQQAKKTIRNSAYGSKRVDQQELFKQLVEHHFESDDPAHTAYDARDYDRVQDAFQEAVNHVRRRGTSKEDYKWHAHPETYDRIRGLYDFHSREPIRKMSTMAMFGFPFMKSPQVPEGWALLADLEHTGYRDLQHGTPAPMALVREVDAGFRDDVPMDCGGRMRFRVINA